MTATPGRTAVVTGANRADGIGLALVRELRARGCAPVVGTYRDPVTSTALLELAAADPDVLAAELDVTSEQSVAAFAQWCAARLDRVDLLLNNAGLGSVTGSIVTAPIEELEEQCRYTARHAARDAGVLPLLGPGSVAVSTRRASAASPGWAAARRTTHPPRRSRTPSQGSSPRPCGATA